MNFAETEEQGLIRENVGKIASQFGPDYFREKSQDHGLLKELWSEIGQQGFVGINLPEEYGGAGLGITELAIVCEELASQGCPLLMLVVNPAISGTVLKLHGSPEQKKEWLPPMATGERRIVFGITEPDAGSNSHRISTTATRNGNGYRLRGTKYYISAVDEADAILVVARTGLDEKTGRGELSLFIVDADAPGLQKDIIPVGITAPENQFTLFFDDVEVPEDRLVGTEGKGLQQVFSGLNPERITSAAVCNGISRYALKKASKYANERSVWKGVPIGAHQGIAHPLAKAKIDVELARLMTTKASWLFDQGLDAGEASNMAKYAAAEAAGLALDRAIQSHGGNGLAYEYGLVHLWGLTKLFQIAPVSREMILNFVSQHSLGLPKSY